MTNHSRALLLALAAFALLIGPAAKPDYGCVGTYRCGAAQAQAGKGGTPDLPPKGPLPGCRPENCDPPPPK